MGLRPTEFCCSGNSQYSCL